MFDYIQFSKFHKHTTGMTHFLEPVVTHYASRASLDLLGLVHGRCCWRDYCDPSLRLSRWCMAFRHLPGWTCGISTYAPSRFPEPWFVLRFSLSSGTGRVLSSWVHQQEELLEVTRPSKAPAAFCLTVLRCSPTLITLVATVVRSIFGFHLCFVSQTNLHRHSAHGLGSCVLHIATTKK